MFFSLVEVNKSCLNWHEKSNPVEGTILTGILEKLWDSVMTFPMTQ